MRRAYILIPGIHTRTDDVTAWPVRMADEIMQKCSATSPAASEYRYYTGAISRRLNQQNHAEWLASLSDKYAAAGFDVVVAAHSNGADILQRALPLMRQPIAAAHLIAAASDRDLSRAGWLRAILTCKLGSLHCYVSAGDKALGRWAALSQSLRWLGLGYGRLGQLGPKLPLKLPADLLAKIHIHRDNSQTHTSWLGESYESIFCKITRLENE